MLPSVPNNDKKKFVLLMRFVFQSVQQKHDNSLTNSLPASITAFLEKLTASSASQEIHILLNPKVHYRVHNSPPLVLILSQIKPIHAPTKLLEYPFQYYPPICTW
jgi:hypothetical protein